MLWLSMYAALPRCLATMIQLLAINHPEQFANTAVEISFDLLSVACSRLALSVSTQWLNRAPSFSCKKIVFLFLRRKKWIIM